MAGNIQKQILFEDKYILVVQKPAGVPVQSRGGAMDLEHQLMNHLALREADGRIPSLYLIHRLDQVVEGILVFARTPEAAAKLNDQLRDGRMKKEYLAVVKGKPEKSQGCLTDYLLKDKSGNMSKIVKPETKGAKKAVLEYRVIAEADQTAAISENDGTKKESASCTLLGIHLITGRHHQIRVQMAGSGMPLLGDRKYNPEPGPWKFPALCAAHLSFKHPQTGKLMEYHCRPQGEAFALFPA